MKLMQHESEATADLVSIAAAAKEIGVNRSTLLRQVKTGQVRSHAGMVRVSEVIEDRGKSVQTRRARRGRGVADHAPPDVASEPNATGPVAWTAASATAVAPVHHDAIAAALSRFLAAMNPVIATMMIEAGVPLKLAYAALPGIEMELMSLADMQLEAAGLPDFGDSYTGEFRCGSDVWMEGLASARRQPDWEKLAKQAGEPCDVEAWEAYRQALPWWQS